MTDLSTNIYNEIWERIVEAAREVIQDVYDENAINNTGLDTCPIEGLNVVSTRNNIFTYNGKTYKLTLK